MSEQATVTTTTDDSQVSEVNTNSLNISFKSAIVAGIGLTLGYTLVLFVLRVLTVLLK